MAAIPMGKTRKVEDPWLTITDGEWEYRVLQAHKKDPDAPYASWFCAVKSPYTFGGWDMGDTYIKDVVASGGWIVQRDPSVPDEALPRALRHSGAKSVTKVGYITVVEVN